MSRLQSARRRLSLLAGSSLVAGLICAAPVALVVAPTAAMAADECTPVPPTLGNGPGPVSDDPTLNAAAADTFSCGEFTYLDGITYVSEGALIIAIPNAPPPNNPQHFINLGVNALSLTGEGTDSVTLTSNRYIAGDQSVFVLPARVAVTTVSGDISMTLLGVQNVSDPVGLGISAISTAGGDISITSANDVTGFGGGILAQTTGAGVVNVDASVANGDTSIEARSGSGAVNVSLSTNTNYTAAIGVLTSTTGLATVNITGTVSATEAAVQALGGQALVNVTGRMLGAVDFQGLSGGGTVDVTGTWMTVNQFNVGAASLFGAGADSVDVAAEGVLGLATARSSAVEGAYTVMTFGGGADALNNDGVVVVNHGGLNGGNPFDDDTSFEAQATITGLEAFNNSGLVVMGSRPFPANPLGDTDLATDDILSMPGATFTGSGDSRIVFDVNLNRGQTSCDAANRDANGDMAGDCVLIAGGATAGTTLVSVNDLLPGDRGSASQIVLVDVGGGTSAAEHFALDPDQPGYNDQLGAIDKGLFIYPLVYNADTQQHALVGVPGPSGLAFPVLAQAAHSLWRTSTGTWFDRQADLRGRVDDGAGSWLRLSTEFANRDVLQPIEAAGNTLTFANDFTQNSYAVNGGLDLISGGALLVGVTAGYAHADVEFDASPNTARFDGWTGGVYASYVTDALFVDAMVNANRLDMDVDIPGLNLFPAGTTVDTRLVSYGAHVEAGWRFPIMGSAFVEPLASVSYVRTIFDDVHIVSDDAARPGLSLQYDDPTSLRASLGARAGLNATYNGIRSQLAITARLWNEFDGESSALIDNLGPDALLYDELTGQFTELGFSAALYSPTEAVSGVLNVGGKFGDDYTATTASAAVRVHW
jgi:hypothetical protein